MLLALNRIALVLLILAGLCDALNRFVVKDGAIHADLVRQHQEQQQQQQHHQHQDSPAEVDDEEEYGIADELIEDVFGSLGGRELEHEEEEEAAGAAGELEEGEDEQEAAEEAEADAAEAAADAAQVQAAGSKPQPQRATPAATAAMREAPFAPPFPDAGGWLTAAGEWHPPAANELGGGGGGARPHGLGEGEMREGDDGNVYFRFWIGREWFYTRMPADMPRGPAQIDALRRAALERANPIVGDTAAALGGLDVRGGSARTSAAAAGAPLTPLELAQAVAAHADVPHHRHAVLVHRSVFAIGSNGRLFERFWNGRKWVYMHHEMPSAANAYARDAASPAMAAGLAEAGGGRSGGGGGCGGGRDTAGEVPLLAVMCVSGVREGKEAAVYHGVVVSDAAGNMYQRLPRQMVQGGPAPRQITQHHLVWRDITPVGERVFGGGVIAPSGKEAFFVSATGRLLERDFGGVRWKGEAAAEQAGGLVKRGGGGDDDDDDGDDDGNDADDDGGDGDAAIPHPPWRLAVVLDAKRLSERHIFCATQDGRLVAYSRREGWVDRGLAVLGKEKGEHGQVGKGYPLAPAPAVVIPDLNSKLGSLFLLLANHRLAEYWWDGGARAFRWVEHGAPPGDALSSAPGALINARSLFLVTRAGNLAERRWDTDVSAWVWVDHGHPHRGTLAAARPQELFHAPANEQHVVVAMKNGRVAARVWRAPTQTRGSKWAWRTYNVPEGGSAKYCSNGALARCREPPPLFLPAFLPFFLSCALALLKCAIY
jgi:hypothetical protein